MCAGNVWVYSLNGKFSENSGDPTYCHPALYWYSFWLITACWIMAGVLLIFTCCFVCCAYGFSEK